MCVSLRKNNRIELKEQEETITRKKKIFSKCLLVCVYVCLDGWIDGWTTWSKAKQRLTFILNFLLFDTETRTIVD